MLPTASFLMGSKYIGQFIGDCFNLHRNPLKSHIIRTSYNVDMRCYVRITQHITLFPRTLARSRDSQAHPIPSVFPGFLQKKSVPSPADSKPRFLVLALLSLRVS